MSARGDDLRAQADAADREDELAQAMTDALESYRANPDPAARAAYRDAVEDLAAHRQASRADRDGLSVVADATEG